MYWTKPVVSAATTDQTDTTATTSHSKKKKAVLEPNWNIPSEPGQHTASQTDTVIQYNVCTVPGCSICTCACTHVHVYTCINIVYNVYYYYRYCT